VLGEVLMPEELSLVPPPALDESELLGEVVLEPLVELP